MSDKLLSGALKVAKVLREAGYEAYYAGGCVRDAELQVAPKDYDIVTNARPEQVDQLFARTVLVGAAFGVVKVLLRGGREYEVATYRCDGAYSDGRRPDEVVYSDSKEQDVLRRDFTLNALLMDPETGEVLDFVGGLDDLRAHVIRAVGDPERRFAEDRLRMLRAVRFAARFGFSLEPKTFDAICANAEQIRDVSVERIVAELHGTWDSARPGLGAELLRQTGLASALFDFLEPDALPQVELRHARLAELPAALPEDQRHAVAWAALLELCSADPEKILRGFNVSRALIRFVQVILRYPDRLRPRDMGTADRIRVVLHPQRQMLLAYLDVLHGQGNLHRKVYETVQAQLEADPLPPLPVLTGKDLLEANIPAGPQFKTILEAVETEVLERRVATKAQALDWVRAHAPIG